jgi:hypothetical protein
MMPHDLTIAASGGCYSGSDGTDSIRAAHFPRWISRESAASPRTLRWPLVRRVW